MKILYHHRTGSKDGQAVHIEELTKALRALGHELLIVGPGTADKQNFGDESGLITTLKKRMPKALYELMEFAYAFHAYRRLKRAYEDFQPDVLYERSSLFMPAGRWLKKRYDLPMLMEVNAPLFDERDEVDGIALKRLARWTERYAWKGADFVLPVTSVLAGILRRAGIPDQRIVVIPNGIDPANFLETLPREEAKKALGLEGKLVLGFTGFVREWHGLDNVIALMSALGDELETPPHLVVVGDGPAREALEAQAAAAGLAARVNFTGLINRDQVANYVAAFDIALQPAVRAYASPLKLFEYMALGCAVVAPDTPNIRDVLTDGVNAVLFDEADEEGFGAAVATLCRDPALRERLAEGAKRTIVEDDYTWGHNARRVEAMMRQLTAPTGANQHAPLEAV